MNNNYFRNDEYWKKHINKELEEDMWLDKYQKYFNNKGKCLDLGCGIGQYSKWFMEKGYDVLSADISDIALKEVSKFNKNIMKLDMMNDFPFEDNTFQLVFANLSIHYFSNDDTKKLMDKIYRILKKGGLFVGSVNSFKGYKYIKNQAVELDDHFYFYNDKNIRLFDLEDVKKYLFKYDILEIKEEETVRFNHKKNYIIFVARKN